MRKPGRLHAALLPILIALALAPDPVAGQQQEPPVDSTELRVRERLERLGRPPGSDSLLFIQDSVARARAEETRAPGGSAPDSVAEALLQMRGYSVTRYEGGQASFEAGDRVLVLRAPEDGRARVDRDGLEVQADTSITYDESTGRVRTVGGSTFTPPQGDPVESVGLIYDLQSIQGTALDARTSYQQGSADWIVRGDMPYANPDSTFMSHARFTSCDLEVPHYHFETDEIKIVGDRVLVARPVRLYFADVPVAWLPFIAQSLSSGRSSGLLTPRFSVNDIVRTSGGYRRRVSNVGFYWAMSDYTDAVVALDWFSDTFTALTGGFRYNWARQFLDGSVNYRQFWRADGGAERSLDTRHAWEPDERTQLRLRGSYASSADFVRDNTFNPREVTQSIDSEGGINRRFDWGTLALGAARRQFLSDDRVTWTLPSANLALSTITLFQAPQNRARVWNNMVWSGSGRFSRETVDRPMEVGDTFALSRANTTTTRSAANQNLTLGNLTLSQSVDLRQEAWRDVPEAWFIPDSAGSGVVLTGGPTSGFSETSFSWSSSVNYQQRLIGSTTLTPSLSITGRQLRNDTSAVAQSFVAAPTRTSLGVRFRTDVYGFFPGFGGFQAVRHKLSPDFRYEWSPEVTPSELQRQVFGSRALQPRNVLSVSLNQTFEAKREEDEAEPEETAQAADTAVAAPEGPAGIGDGTEGPRRLDRAEVVKLLGIQTSVIRYDFVEADSVGEFLAGFETTRLTNQISSDLLRGLSLSMEHDLFEEEPPGEGRVGGGRTFAPTLTQLNLSFALNDRSGFLRWIPFIGRGGGDEEEPEEEEVDEDEELDAALDPLAEGVLNESSIVPTGEGLDGRRTPRRREGRGGWSANLSYALQRPRSDQGATSQVLNASLSLRPTEQWDLTWRTSYDLEQGQFNDHTIRLSRDLHRWRANFDFLQTATGNWTFRFEVSLIDNQDLKFDYQQRNLDAGLPASQRR